MKIGIIIKKYSVLFIGTFSILFLDGCKTYQPVSITANKTMPDSFTVKSSDTASTADFSWRSFFADPILIGLIDTALRNNPDLLMASEKIQIAQAYFQKTRGAFVPTVNAISSVGVEKYGDYTMNGVGNYDTNLSPNISNDQKIPHPTPDLFLGVRSSWEIDIWGKLKNRKKAAAAKLLANKSGRRLITTELVSEIAASYYSLLFLDKELQIIQKNTRYQEAALEIVKSQKEGGRATELAVQQFQAQLYHTRSFEYKINQNIIETEGKINFLMGRFQQPIVRENTALATFIPQKIKTGLPSQLLLRRPDIQEAELSLTAAAADVNAARAAYLPSFTINPFLGINAFSASLLFQGGSLTYGLLTGLSAPLLNKNDIKTDYSIAVSQNKQALYNYQKLIVNGCNEVYTGIHQIDNFQKMFNLKEQEVAQLSMAVSSANELYVTGYASYLEVITAQKTVLEAELELNDSQKNIALSLIHLYKALGGGWK